LVACGQRFKGQQNRKKAADSAAFFVPGVT
jgi:hypothetical protein